MCSTRCMIYIRLLLFLWAHNHNMLFYFYGIKLRLFSRKYSEKKTKISINTQIEIRTLDSTCPHTYQLSLAPTQRLKCYIFNICTHRF